MAFSNALMLKRFFIAEKGVFASLIANTIVIYIVTQERTMKKVEIKMEKIASSILIAS